MKYKIVRVIDSNDRQRFIIKYKYRFWPFWYSYKELAEYSDWYETKLYDTQAGAMVKIHRLKKETDPRVGVKKELESIIIL